MLLEQFLDCRGIFDHGHGTGEVASSVGYPSPFAAFPPGDLRRRHRLRADDQGTGPVGGNIFVEPALGAGNKGAVLILVSVKVSSAPWATRSYQYLSIRP